MNKSTKIWLIAIFAFVLALRLIIAFQIQYLDYEAYSTLRHVNSIKDSGLPLFKDELSYSGRTHVFSPVYHYFLALFSLFIPLELVAKIVPNILATLTLIVVFFIARTITEEDTTSLLTAGISGIVPVFFNNTINNASIYSAVIPLFFLTVYYFISTLRDETYVNKLLISMVALTLIHPASFILVLSLLIYAAFVKIQGFRESKRTSELVLFFLFLVFWVNMIIYKNAFLFHKETVIWQNVPQTVLMQFFGEVTFIESILSIGALPLIFGLISIYSAFFIIKRKTLTLLMSICTAIFLLVWLQFIQLSIGLMFLGIALCVMSAEALRKIYDSSKMLKLKNAAKYFVYGSAIIALITFLPTVTYILNNQDSRPGQEDVVAFKWLKENVPENSVILTHPKEGSAMSFYSGKKNVMDENYLLIPNIDARYKDVTGVYKQRFLTSALETFNYYGINYVLLTNYSQEKLGIKKLYFLDDSCFEYVYPEIDSQNNYQTNLQNHVRIYELKCILPKN